MNLNERYRVMRTVDSQGNLVGNQDDPHRGLIVDSADSVEEAQQLACDDFSYHAQKHLPVGDGCYYILDTETDEVFFRDLTT